MAENVIHVRGTRADVRRIVAKAVAAATGATGDASDAAKGMQLRIGMTALAHIRDSFVTKARGGTDESGLSWPPLSPKTIAYSRRHPGVPKNRSDTRPSWMLGKKEKDAWWTTYRRGLAMFKGDRSRAARYAWAVAKRNGAKTLIGEYGDTQVEILRDTGLLLNSLSPGIPGSVEHQVFRTGLGNVIIGTNRKWAGVHHHGSSRIPQRRLWPEPSQWPNAWWSDIAGQAREGLIEIIEHIARNL